MKLTGKSTAERFSLIAATLERYRKDWAQPSECFFRLFSVSYPAFFNAIPAFVFCTVNLLHAPLNCLSSPEFKLLFIYLGTPLSAALLAI